MLPIIEMLGLPFLACVMMVMILGYLGTHVLKREIIFIDIALAQMAAVGSIVAHLAFEVDDDSPIAYAFAFGFVVLASLFYALVRGRVLHIPLEAVIGVSYAISAAGALFLVGTAPGGHVHIQQMLAGSLLWSTEKDIMVSLAVFLPVGIFLFFLRGPMNRSSDTYRDSRTVKPATVAWDFLFYALMGLVITFAVRLAGVVVVFAFLIIPATVATLFSTNNAAKLAMTWMVGVLSSLGGLLFAYGLDFSVGPSIAVFLGVALEGAALGKRLWPDRDRG